MACEESSTGKSPVEDATTGAPSSAEEEGVGSVAEKYWWGGLAPLDLMSLGSSGPGNKSPDS